MTRDELVHMLERLQEAGCSAEQLVAAASADRDWRLERKLLRAAARAVAPAPVSASQINVASTPISTAVPQINVAATPIPDADMNDAATVADTIAPAGRDDGLDPNRQKMFHRARERLQQAAALSPNERHVGLALLSHYNHRNGRLYPSMATLGVTSNTSERTARRAVRQLAALGLFAVQAHAGYRNSNSYRPHWAALLALASRAEVNAAAAPKMNDAANLAATSARPGQIDAANPATGGRQTSESNLKKSSVVGQQLELRVFGAVAGTGVRRMVSGDPVEASIRGKYREHDTQTRMLSAWWGLDDAQRAGIGDLKSFEAWLRERGPPRAASGGG